MIDNSQLVISQKLLIANLSSAIDLAIAFEVEEDNQNEFVLQNFIVNHLLKNLNDKINYWKLLQISSSSNYNNDIKESFIAIANYLDSLYHDDREIRNLISVMFRDQDSRFFNSIDGFSGMQLKNLMNHLFGYISEIVKIIEQSDEQYRADNLLQVRKALLTFPCDINIDFRCINGTINRIQEAVLSLKLIPLNIQIINEVNSQLVNRLSSKVSDVLEIHIPKSVRSLLTLSSIDDYHYRSSDNYIDLKDIFKFVINYKKQIIKELDQRLLFCSQRIIDIVRSGDINDSVKYKEITKQLEEITLEIELEDLTINQLFLDNDPYFPTKDEDGVEKLKIDLDKLKTSQEIKNLLAQLLQEKFPDIYKLPENQTQDDHAQTLISQDAIDHLASLDIFLNFDSASNKILFDPKKINNFLELFPLPSEIKSKNEIEKIKAGLLILNILARDFTNSDPIIFTILLDKLTEKIGELNQYLTDIPVELGQILKIKNIEELFKYISDKKISKNGKILDELFSYQFRNQKFQAYKNLYLLGDFDVPNKLDLDWIKIDLNAIINFALQNHHLNSIRALSRYGELDDNQKSNIINFLLENNYHQLLISSNLLGMNRSSWNQLYKYILIGNADFIYILLKNNLNPRSLFDSVTKKSILQIAIENYSSSNEADPVKKSRLRIIYLLLEHQADANAIDPETKKSLLQIVIENYSSSKEVDPEINDRKMAIIRSLLEHGADAKAIDLETQKSLLQIAIKNIAIERYFFQCDHRIFKLLLEKNIDLNLLNQKEKQSLLQIVTYRIFSSTDFNDVKELCEIAKILIAKDIDLYRLGVDEQSDRVISLYSSHLSYDRDLLSPFDNILRRIYILQDPILQDYPSDDEARAIKIENNLKYQNKLFEILELMIEKGFNINRNYKKNIRSFIDEILSFAIKDVNKERSLRIFEHFSSKIPSEELLSDQELPNQARCFSSCFSRHSSSVKTNPIIKNNSNFVDKNKDNLLHLACINGNVKIVRKLLAENFDPRVKNEIDKKNSLIKICESKIATIEEKKEIIKLLFEKTPSLRLSLIEDDHVISGIFRITNSKELLEFILDSKYVEINDCSNAKKENILQLAIKNIDLDWVKFLIERNPELLNHKDKDHQTPLFLAIKNIMEISSELDEEGNQKRIEIAKLIIQKVSKIDSKTQETISTLSHPEIKTMLEEKSRSIQQGVGRNPSNSRATVVGSMLVCINHQGR